MALKVISPEVDLENPDKFDAYMSGINQVREHDENYEKRTAELLSRMQEQNKQLTTLIADLGTKISSLTADTGDGSLKEICKVLNTMESSVGSISTTLSALAKEA